MSASVGHRPLKVRKFDLPPLLRYKLSLFSSQRVLVTGGAGYIGAFFFLRCALGDDSGLTRLFQLVWARDTCITQVPMSYTLSKRRGATKSSSSTTFTIPFQNR